MNWDLVNFTAEMIWKISILAWMFFTMKRLDAQMKISSNNFEMISLNYEFISRILKGLGGKNGSQDSSDHGS